MSPTCRYGGEFGLDPAAKHSKRGMLSTANAGPFTDGSQVFVTFVETSYLSMSFVTKSEWVQ